MSAIRTERRRFLDHSVPLGQSHHGLQPLRRLRGTKPADSQPSERIRVGFPSLNGCRCIDSRLGPFALQAERCPIRMWQACVVGLCARSLSELRPALGKELPGSIAERLAGSRHDFALEPFNGRGNSGAAAKGPAGSSNSISSRSSGATA